MLNSSGVLPLVLVITGKEMNVHVVVGYYKYA